MPLIVENFTAADNTNLNGFGGWSTHPIGVASLLIFSNKVTKDNNSSAALLMHSTPVSGDGYIQATLGLMSVLAANAAICISLHPTSDDYVWLRHTDGTTWTLRSTVPGNPVAVLGTFSESLNPGDTRIIRIERRFNAGNIEFRALVAGIERIPWTVSNGHTGTRVGMRFSGAASSTTGYSIDDLEAGVTLPTAPTNLSLSAPSPTQVDLSWVDNSNNEESFRIERKTGAGGNYVEIASNSADDSTYSDSTVVASTTYFYRVRARNNAGDSAYLAEQSITTPAAGGSLPTAPSNLSLIARSALQVDLSWVDNSNNEVSFRVERKVGSGGTYAEIASVAADVTKFLDVTTQASTTYFYRVRARNANGDSAYAPEQSITTPRTVSVYIWNVQHGQGTDLNTDYNRQVNRLKVANDILCIQERGTGDAGWTNAGLDAAGFTEAIYRENGHGNDGPSIWVKSSRVTVLQPPYQTDLSEGAVGWGGVNVDKSAVGIKCVVDGFQFYVFCTHLAWSAGADAQNSPYSVIRDAQGKTLLNWIAGIVGSDLNYFVCADYNFAPDYPRRVIFTVPDHTNDTLVATDHWWLLDNPVSVFTEDGTLPSPLVADTTYYVRDVTTNSLKLAATPGGAAINITTSGSGTLYLKGLQEDLYTGRNLVDQWKVAIAAGKATADWGDRDANGQPDMPISDLGSFTSDVRRIDGVKLRSGANLTIRQFDMPDHRAQCPHALIAGVCSPEVQRTWGNAGDFGVRESDHNPLRIIYDLPAVDPIGSANPALWVDSDSISIAHSESDSSSIEATDSLDTVLISVKSQDTGISESISVGATNNANI